MLKRAIARMSLEPGVRGAAAFVFAALLVLAIFVHPTSPVDAARRHVERNCDPVTRSDALTPSQWADLESHGWTVDPDNPDLLYVPGCEAAR